MQRICTNHPSEPGVEELSVSILTEQIQTSVPDLIINDLQSLAYNYKVASNEEGIMHCSSHVVAVFTTIREALITKKPGRMH